MDIKRVTLFAGHYGSGKTNIAVNWALYLRRQGYAVTVADLDIVNPYFRTKDSARELEEAGIRMIASPFANSNVDVPALPGELYAVVDDKTSHAVLDVGGDDRGALALGRYSPAIREENDYAMLGVLNFARPLTATPADAVEVLREVEAAGSLPFTGLINNTNIGVATTPETVLQSVKLAEETARLMGLPLVMTTAETSVAAALAGQVKDLFPLTLQTIHLFT
ncbi:MAG: hypothetical protein E7549_06100 [Ruminococcaceae bacterium]|nr:hypothetical protein [Oscillospiraceae bacterium]